MRLIDTINSKTSSKISLVPKPQLSALNAGFKKGTTLLNAEKNILKWVIESMGPICKEHDVPLSQALDSIQHYRFGIYQAKKLIEASGTKAFDLKDTEAIQRITLFTSVHDIGRMMVGSGASEAKFTEKDEGNRLHSVVGAIMLREAFDPLRKKVSGGIGQLFDALIATAERHNLALGLSEKTTKKFELNQIKRVPYEGYQESFLLIDKTADLGKYGRYAHLIALADLINNVDQPLNGVSQYIPQQEINLSDTDGILNYLAYSNDKGAFKVIRKEEDQELFVNRSWKGGLADITPENYPDCLKKMEAKATAFETSPSFIAAFNMGIERAFNSKIA